MIAKKLTFFTPLLFSLLLMVTGCAYFFTPIKNYTSEVFGFILLTSLVLAVTYYFNEFLSKKNETTYQKDKYSFIRTKALESDVDQLSEIVRELAMVVNNHEERILTINKPVAIDFTLFLRPISNLSTKSVIIYEALTEARVKRETDQLSRILQLINKSSQVLNRLKIKTPDLKILINIPFSLLDNKMLLRTLHETPLRHDLILNLEGISDNNFSASLSQNLKTLNNSAIVFCLTESASLNKTARIKPLFEMKALGISYLRYSYGKLEETGALKADFDIINNSGLNFIIDDLDDTIDPQLIQSWGIPLGQGPKIGIARPVKAEMTTENRPLSTNNPTLNLSVTEPPEYRKSA